MIKIKDDKLYIRFGDIPKREVSHEYKSGVAVDTESGVSVWDALESNGIYHPILPNNPNKDAVADYFKLLYSNRPIYLVTGTELSDKGSDGEPLLKDIKIIKNYNSDYYSKFYTISEE